jgi:23S rRNA pseudouridine1911/1915/1917 synthase
MQQFIVPTKLHGQRIDIVLAKLLPEFSRSQLSHWLQQEKITVNAKPAKPKYKVSSGDEITVFMDLIAEENRIPQCGPENIPLDIVFEDEAILVVNKPSGLIVHPGAGNANHTLVNALLYHEPSLSQLPRAGIVHRLDKETTGLLVIAKTNQSLTHISRQIQARSMRRGYLALVQGHLISGGEITTAYGRHPKNRLKMAVLQQGREAITRFSLKKQYQDYTLLDVQLMTGRTHQIRVHMAHINHPIVGDPLYGGRIRFPKMADETLLDQLKAFQRQALHAISLTLQHPTSHEILSFEAPLPEDFAMLLLALDAHYQQVTP